MKKLLLAIITCILILNTPHSYAFLNKTTFEENIGPELTISNITGGIFSFTIKNIGDENATNVSWHLKLKGGIMLLGRERGSIHSQNLIPGEEYTVFILTYSRIPPERLFIFGFGRVTINITVDADDIDPVTETASGFLLGLFILRVKTT